MKVAGGAVLFALVLCFGIGISQRIPQATLYPFEFDGIEIVMLDDMSYVTEIHVQTFPPNNWTFIIFGSSTVRTVYPMFHTFEVGTTPNEDWHLNFIDLRTVQVGNDIWGFGPIDPFGLGGQFRQSYGYEIDVAVVTTKQGGRFWRFSPIGYEGTFFSVRPYVFGDTILSYFAGFFPEPTSPSILHFGILRARFNTSADTGIPNANPSNWVYNSTLDVAVIVNASQFVTYNAAFKPIMYHLFNVTGAPDPNTTYTVVVDPGTRLVKTVIGSITPGTPLTVSPQWWQPPPTIPFGGITSAHVYYPLSLIILGIAVPGTGSGAIAFVHVLNLTTRGVINLPTNYSDPKALVVDDDNGTLYVGMNGNSNLLRIDINTMAITGYQNVPRWVEHTWAGRPTPEHIFFVTSEAHSKVYRVSKHNFCTTQCPEFGYCYHGACTCTTNFELINGQCQYITLIKDADTIKRDQTGLAVLGIFFAVSFVAAAAGWYLVWRSKRQGYQAV